MPVTLSMPPSMVLCPIVLYHPSSGWIYLTSGQDLLHSDYDITKYMQHKSLMVPWHPCSHLSLLYFHPTVLLLSKLLPSEPTTCRQNTPLADPMKLGYHLQTLQSRPNLWHYSLWRKCGTCG